MAESAEQAAMRAIGSLCDEIRAEARAADRRVIDRIVSEDEDGRPRLRVVEDQADDASERAERGLF